MPKTHGMTKTRAYNIWFKMKMRCDKKENHAYKYYGGRGISYDRSWLKFENFISDMGHPKSGETLDRIDNSKGYYKENCRWTDMKTQSRNRSSNILIEINGEKGCISYFAEKHNICQKIAQKRYKKGVPVELIFKNGLVYKKNGQWINKEDWFRPKPKKSISN